MLRRAAVASAASLGEGEGEWAGDLVAEGDEDAFFAVAAKDVHTRPPGTQLRRVFDVLWAFIAGEGKESGGPGGDSGSSGSRPSPGARERLAQSVAAAVVEASRLDITAESAPARTGPAGTTSRDPEPALVVTPEASPTPPVAPLAAPTETETEPEHAGFTAATGSPFGGDDDADDPFGAIGSRGGGAFSPAGVAASNVRVVALPGGDLPASGLLLLRRESRRRRGEGRGTPAATRCALHSRARVLVPSRRDRRRTRGGCVDPAALARFPVPRGCVPGGSRGLAGGGDGGG
jgi:hypothetical protein